MRLYDHITAEKHLKEMGTQIFRYIGVGADACESVKVTPKTITFTSKAPLVQCRAVVEVSAYYFVDPDWFKKFKKIWAKKIIKLRKHAKDLHTFRGMEVFDYEAERKKRI